MPHTTHVCILQIQSVCVVLYCETIVSTAYCYSLHIHGSQWHVGVLICQNKGGSITPATVAVLGTGVCSNTLAWYYSCLRETTSCGREEERRRESYLLQGPLKLWQPRFNGAL